MIDRVRFVPRLEPTQRRLNAEITTALYAPQMKHSHTILFSSISFKKTEEGRSPFDLHLSQWVAKNLVHAIYTSLKSFVSEASYG